MNKQRPAPTRAQTRQANHQNLYYLITQVEIPITTSPQNNRPQFYKLIIELIKSLILGSRKLSALAH